MGARREAIEEVSSPDGPGWRNAVKYYTTGDNFQSAKCVTYKNGPSEAGLKVQRISQNRRRGPDLPIYTKIRVSGYALGRIRTRILSKHRADVTFPVHGVSSPHVSKGLTINVPIKPSFTVGLLTPRFP